MLEEKLFCGTAYTKCIVVEMTFFFFKFHLIVLAIVVNAFTCHTLVRSLKMCPRQSWKDVVEKVGKQAGLMLPHRRIIASKSRSMTRTLTSRSKPMPGMLWPFWISGTELNKWSTKSATHWMNGCNICRDAVAKTDCFNKSYSAIISKLKQQNSPTQIPCIRYNFHLQASNLSILTHKMMHFNFYITNCTLKLCNLF